MFKGVIKRFIEPYGEALVKIRDINETYQLFLTEVGSLPQEALNADESIINFKNGLLWFCMNRLPKFGGDDGKWVYDRIMVVDCPNVIPKDQQDRTLLDKMYRERRGIIQKAVKALQIVLSNSYRFDEPESVLNARQQYMDGNNTVVTFFEECMQPWVNGKIQKHCTTGRIYKVYQAWCRENNNGYAKTAKEFREGLADYLGSSFDELTTRQKGYTYYKTYGLTPEAKELYRAAYGYDADEEFLTG